MDSTLAIELSQPYGAACAPTPTATAGQSEVSFHDALTVLNPLQYVPVVGNIYRAITGDIPPEPVRWVGGAIFSALTGGPVGVAIYAAIIAAEKLTGLDPDDIAHSVLASVGLVDEAPPVAVASEDGSHPPSDTSPPVDAGSPSDAAPVPRGFAIAAYARAQQIGTQQVERVNESRG